MERRNARRMAKRGKHPRDVAWASSTMAGRPTLLSAKAGAAKISTGAVRARGGLERPSQKHAVRSSPIALGPASARRLNCGLDNSSPTSLNWLVGPGKQEYGEKHESQASNSSSEHSRSYRSASTLF